MKEISDSSVLFLQGRSINESLGLCDLAGHLKKLGARTGLFIKDEERHLPEKIRDFAPDMVVIPCDLLGHNAALDLARTAKKVSSATVVLGGTHPTFFHHVVLQQGVDYAFAGEAEGVVTELLQAVLQGEDPSQIPNLIVRENGGYRLNPLRPLLDDLNELAEPDRDIYYRRYPYLAKFPWKKFATGRGCLNSCGFCFNPSYRKMIGTPKNFLRRKSSHRIAQEINAVRARYPLNKVHFSDDLFTSGAEWLAGFIDVYRHEVNIPFSCNIYASLLTAEVVDLLKKGNCRLVAMGVETADENLRIKTINKPITDQQLVEAAQMVKQAGIELVTYNILGMPWSSIDTELDTMLFNRRLRSDHTWVTLLVPFPKSAVTRRLIKDGYLTADFDQRVYEIPDLPDGPKDIFRHIDAARRVRLYRLWYFLYKRKWSKKRLQKLVDSRWSFLLYPLSTLVGVINIKRVFDLGWWPGFVFFLHVKNPGTKTTNYVSFI